MEACVVFCRSNKRPERQGKVLFINAVSELVKERATAHLGNRNIERIKAAFGRWETDDGFARVVSQAEIAANGYTLNIARYLAGETVAGSVPAVKDSLASFLQSRGEVRSAVDELWSVLEAGLVA